MEENELEHKPQLSSFERGQLRDLIATDPEERRKLQRLIDSVDQIEKLLKSYERSTWLWTSVGIWVKWFGIVGTAIVATRLLWLEVKQLILTLQ